VAAGVRLDRILLGAIVVAASLIYAYVEMFSQFRFYDDEGFLMASVKSFVDGAALYDETPTLYGPFYYLVAKFLYFLAGVPVSHDATRLATVAFWLGTAALTAGFVYRLTSSVAWTSIAYLQMVLYGWRLTSEPGHPQTLLIFLGVSVPLAAAVLAPKRAGSALLGILAACITLTKINVGVYTLVALMVVYLGVSERTPLIRAGFFASSVIATVLPFVLMRSDLSEWTLNYACTTAMTIAACCVTMGRGEMTNRLQKSGVGVFIASGITTAVVVVSPILLRGTSLETLVTEAVLAPARFPTMFVAEWRVSSVAVVVAAVSLALAVVCARLDGSLRAALAVWIKLALGAGVAVTLNLHPSSLIAVAPLIWVTLISPRSEPSRLDALFPRAIVLLLAALYLLIAYPVNGSQQAWATMLLIPVAILNLTDAWRVLAWRMHPAVRRATQATLLAVVLVAYSIAFDPLRLLDKHRALSPLNLHGATRIRLDARQVRVYQDLVESIDRDCDTFATVPNLMSLHFWTRQAPRGGLNAEAWMTLIDDETRHRLVSKYMPWPRIPKNLVGHPSACVIFNQRAANRWASFSEIDDGPLISYIHQSFRTVRTIGDYELMVRNEDAWRFPDNP
jgi:hypothetical protein